MGYVDIVRQTVQDRKHASSRPRDDGGLARPPELGTVVRVRSMTGREELGVILAVHREAEGRWFFLGPGDARWVREMLIGDWTPSCLVCQQRAWCWLGMAVIRCGRCHPAQDADWRQAWRLLAEITDGLTRDDPCLSALDRALDAGERATKDRDWGGLQHAAIQVHWLMECHAREHWRSVPQQ